MFPQPRLCLVAFATLLAGFLGENCEAQSVPAALPGAERYREYAMQAEADATLGRALFENAQKTLCATCHTIDGTAQKVGPDLSAIGDKFPKEGLIRAVLEPSAEIAVGFANTIVRTSSGEVVSGIIRQSDRSMIELMSADSQRHRIARNTIAEQSDAPTSLMPQGLHSALSLQEFADLIAFLGTLHQKAGSSATDEIPLASKGVTFENIFTGEFRLDRPVWFRAVPSQPGAYVALEHFGRVVRVDLKEGQATSRTFLDLRGIVRPGGASGLLGMAFHPRFPENR